MRTLIFALFLVVCGSAVYADSSPPCDTRGCDLPKGCTCVNPRGQWCVTACRSCCGVRLDKKKEEEKKASPRPTKPKNKKPPYNKCRYDEVEDGGFCRPANYP